MTAAVLRTVTGDVDPVHLDGRIAAFVQLAPDWRPIGERDPDVDLPSTARIAAARGAGERVRTAVLRAKQRGVSLIVDATPPGAGRDPIRLADTAAATDVAIVACTGAHAPPSRLARIDDRSAEYLAEWFAFEVTNGIAAVAGDRFRGIPIMSERAAGAASDVLNDAAVRAGAIRITLASPTLDRGDLNLLEAAALASRATGVATYLDAPSGTDLDAVAIRFEAAGASRTRLILAPGHRTPDESVAAASLGLAIVIAAPTHRTEGAIAIWEATVRSLDRLGLVDQAMATYEIATTPPRVPLSPTSPDDVPVDQEADADLTVSGIEATTTEAVFRNNACRILSVTHA